MPGMIGYVDAEMLRLTCQSLQRTEGEVTIYVL